MTSLVVVTALLTAAAVGAAVFFALRSRPADPAMSLLQQQLESLRGQVSSQLEAVARTVSESQRSVGDRLDGAARVVGEVQKSLGALGQASQRIFDVGKDIAGLTDLLRSPKLRGGLGEYFLGDLLAQILPAAHFSLQHAFKSGHVVDAAVRLGGRLVPVDAKFPLENFRRWLESAEPEERRAWRRKFGMDVKRHVDAISSKYILPDEDTYDFALMYIPAENVYYECVVKAEEGGEEAALMDYALSKRVVPVSPASFYAYLQAILLGLKGFQIEENAKLIMQNLARLQGDLVRFTDDFDMMGKHLANAKSKHEDASRRLERVRDKLTSAAQDAPLPLGPAVSQPVLPASKTLES